MIAFDMPLKARFLPATARSGVEVVSSTEVLLYERNDIRLFRPGAQF
jgi:hypothetical protein